MRDAILERRALPAALGAGLRSRRWSRIREELLDGRHDGRGLAFGGGLCQ